MFKDAHQGESSHELDQLGQPTNREKPRGSRTPDARSLQEHAHPSSSSTDSDSSSETSLPGTDITRRTSSATVRSDKNRSAIARLWREHVNVAVDHKACRDHLALERTYLAYLRTSVMLANVGVLVAQLFALQQSDEGFGYSAIGKPMASVCFSAAIVTILLGTARAWRFRKALINGKALSGGWEMMSIAVGFLVITGLFFGFLVAIDVVKSSKAPVSS